MIHKVRIIGVVVYVLYGMSDLGSHLADAGVFLVGLQHTHGKQTTQYKTGQSRQSKHNYQFPVSSTIHKYEAYVCFLHI